MGIANGRCIRLAVAALIWAFCAVPVVAHRPHDDVQQLEIVNIAGDELVGLTVVRNNLLRSEIKDGTWAPFRRSVKGLTNRYGISGLLASRSEPGTVFLSAVADGVFRSRDGGHSWSPMNAGLGSKDVRLLAISATGVPLATDAAGTLWIHPSENEGWTQAARVKGRIMAAAFSPVSGIVLGTADGRLLRVDRSGRTSDLWSGDAARAITDIELTPGAGEGEVIFAASDGAGVLVSRDGGRTFTTVLDGQRVTDLAVSPDVSSGPMVAATWTSVFLSEDLGATWRETDSGLTRSSQAETERYLSPHFRKARVRAAGDGYETIVGGYSGLFVLSERDDQWRELDTLPAGIIMNFAVSEPDAKGVHAIAIGSYGAGVAVSQDDGASWSVAPDALPDARVRDVAFSPDYQADGTLLAATKGSVLIATRPGFDWQEISLRRKGVKAFAVGIIRPPVERLMRASAGFADFMNKYSPRPDPTLTAHPSQLSITEDKQVVVGTSLNGLFAAPRYHQGFKRIAAFNEGEVSAIATFRNPASKTSLYVATSVYTEPPDPDSTPTLHVSENSAWTWSSVPMADLVNGRLLVAVGAAGLPERRLLAGSSAGLVHSRDGGASWQRPKTPEVVRSGTIVGLAVSPGFAEDGTILVSVKGEGLYASTDGGVTFGPVGDGLRETGISISHHHSFPAASAAIRFSPDYVRNGVIFGTTGYEIMKSSDRGQTWQKVPGPDLGRQHH